MAGDQLEKCLVCRASRLLPKPGNESCEDSSGVEDGASSATAFQSLEVSQLRNVPPELRSGKAFVVWHEEIRDGKPTKIPVDPKTGREAKSNNPATWVTFDKAVQFYKAHRKRFRGIGRMFPGDDGIMGVDLDNCLDGHGKIIPDSLADTWLPRFDSYTEVSPSGRGAKVWVCANHKLDGKGGRHDAKLGVEIYSARRYFTLTGKRLEKFSKNVESRQQEIEEFYNAIFPEKKKAPATCSPPNTITVTLGDDEIIRRAWSAKNSQKFQALWNGNIDGHGSQSEADAALCSILWFQTGDRERVRYLFGQSALGQRYKWKDRPDYQEATLDLACKGKVYSTPRERDGTDRESEDEENPARKSAATRLVSFADEYTFFHDPQGRPFVRLEINRHTEVWPVESTKFRKLLARIYYEKTKKAINRNALSDAVITLAGMACHEGNEEPVFLRVAPHGDNILIDLCDAQWRVVEVTSNGWQILDKSPVAFIRTGSMQSLPEPVSGGSIEPLWELLNVTKEQRPLVAGGLLNAYHPDGPYFVVNFVGEQGTAKTCGARIYRQLVDPNENPFRSPPKEERDLLAQAASNRCVALDNLSSLPAWQSDAICRLSTGGGHSARELYTDLEEISLAVKRPVLLNGIEDVATRPDLAERVLQIELEKIPDSRRICEKDLWRKFGEEHARIFSGILNALVCALRELPNVKLNSLPRMADAAIWATAGESAFGFIPEAFMAAYRRNLDEGAVASVEAHPVGVAIRKPLEKQGDWEGEHAELLEAIAALVSQEQRSAKNWPQNARSLSACLRRLPPALRRSGINYETSKGRRRIIRICKAGNFASQPSFASQSDTEHGDAGDANSPTLHASANEADPDEVAAMPAVGPGLDAVNGELAVAAEAQHRSELVIARL